jgi:ATP-binding cassette subfamily B (MDR/TAP) protein 10
VVLVGLSSFYTELMRGIGASTRTWEIIDRVPSIPIIDNVDVKKFENCLHGDITFENITFAYPTRQEQNIFKNFNLTIPGGKILAVVGSSGSGKSTLGSLILRFYDPDVGTVKIGGVDIRDMPQNWLRNHIGTVPQDICLFSTTIKDNIAYGVPGKDLRIFSIGFLKQFRIKVKINLTWLF